MRPAAPSRRRSPRRCRSGSAASATGITATAGYATPPSRSSRSACWAIAARRVPSSSTSISSARIVPPILGDAPDWLRARDELHAEILARGIEPSAGHLVQAYGVNAMDASLLVTPFTGFPIERAAFERTVARIEKELRDGDFVSRYL